MQNSNIQLISKYFILLSFLCFLSPQWVSAQEATNTIRLSLPADFTSTICSSMPWSGKLAKWEGVIDERNNMAIGEQSKNGALIEQVTADPTVQSVFESSLKQLFVSCGIKWSNNESAPSIKVTIVNFFAGSSKKLLTGTGTANSKLRIEISKGCTVEPQPKSNQRHGRDEEGPSLAAALRQEKASGAEAPCGFATGGGDASPFMIETGFQIDNKGLRKTKLKQLQATLNELLAETLKQIPQLSQIGQNL